ncbi:GNAT family N-acetyltransferase [Nocardia wallacei]|uniref:GNAT family N-acetyltransferase n=1 Tax=Nocardia wallacei TaxID=480035 RepID=UPI002453884B|nr:GNAT family N-acetyltransferase [Nocardia wallacei]
MQGFPAIGIRTATEHDKRALAAIDHVTWSTQVAPVPLWHSETPFFNEGTSPDDVLLAYKDDHVLSYVKLRPSPIPTSSGHVREINGFAVDPNHPRSRHRALASRRRFERSNQSPGRRITLRVLGTNTRAQEIYLAHGFRIEGRLVGQFLLDDRYVDDVLMALEICPSDEQTDQD